MKTTVLEKKPVKIAMISLSVIVAVALLIFATISVLRMISPVKKAATVTQTVAEIKFMAGKAENKGETEDAIDLYRKAAAEYTAKGDTYAAADASAKITQLEKSIAFDKQSREQSIADNKRWAADAGSPPLIDETTTVNKP